MSGFGDNLMVTGQIIGTGVAYGVECGFVPRRVEVFNSTKLSLTTWVSANPTAYDEGWSIVDSGSGTTDISLLTGNGISAYAGAAPYANLTGTFDCTAGSASVAAGDVTTWFLEELRVGDEVMISGVVYSVIAIASDTALTVDRPIGATVNEGTLVRVTGRQPGFTLGTTINADNDVITYTAWR